MFEELKRRNVIRVSLAYLVTAWLVLQVSDVVLGNIGAPDWVFKVILLVLALGFPFVLIFAWAFELTPGGLKRERDVDRSRSTSGSGRRFDYVIMATLALALGYFLWEHQRILDSAEPRISEGKGDQTSEAPTQSKRRSIAVLPFRNLSSDEEQDWFADGLTEELLNSLARTADLLVTARTSAFKYKSTNKDIRTIANELGVENVLEGSVRRSGERVRVTAQLIRASDGFHLWSQSYDRKAEDIIDLQEELATAIAHALETAIDPEALATMISVGTNSVLAYESYLRGLELQQKAWSSVTFDDASGSLDAFRKAVEYDPTFSRAYVGIANSWGFSMDDSLTPNQENELKIAAIDKAIAHERNPIERLGFRAGKAQLELDLLAALRLNTEYLASRPNSQEAQARQIMVLRWLGRQQEAIDAARIYYERDGYDVHVTDTTLHVLRDGSDRDFAIEFANMVMERFPDQPLLLNQVHRLLLVWGETESARALPDIVQRLSPNDSRMAHMTMQQLCAEGNEAEAQRIFDHAIRNHTFPDERAYWLAYTILGRDKEAVDLLYPVDNAESLPYMSSFLGYGFFDPRPYPYLMSRLESKGIPPRTVTSLSNRCRAGSPD